MYLAECGGQLMNPTSLVPRASLTAFSQPWNDFFTMAVREGLGTRLESHRIRNMGRKVPLGCLVCGW